MTEGRTDNEIINCKLIRETAAAWLIDDGKIEVWVPKSQCELYDRADGTKDLSIPEWLAKKKDLL